MKNKIDSLLLYYRATKLVEILYKLKTEGTV